MLKFDEIVKVNGIEINKKYIESIDGVSRKALIQPIFDIFRSSGWIYPDDISKLSKEWKRVIACKSDIDSTEIYNNSSIGTYICKYFCHNFYNATERDKKGMIEIFNDDDMLKRTIENRLGLDWLEADSKGAGVNEAFSISMRMLIQGFRSQRMINATSMFKADVAKFICEKYSNVGDVVGDYSCGFGGRLLGAMSCGRKYIGTDPLTVDELESMAKYFKFKDYELIKSGSEDYCGVENSIDLYWSSPPYFDQESYSTDKSQAYNNGEDYFYNTYWRKTLENVKFMLKKDCWFGLNVVNYPRMLDIAKEYFGEVVETVGLRTVRSHLTKSAGTTKFEYVYMFKNVK